MALVAHFDLELHPMDVKTGFLNEDLEENVYMDQPMGFLVEGMKYMSLTRRHRTPQRPHCQSSSRSFLLENRDFLMLLTTFFVVLIGCVVVFIWCRSSSPKAKPLEPPKRVIEKLPEIEVDDDTKKVTILFSTQTGTVEGFAKV
ncbi:NADPH--cytochrome P450 reductase 2 [Glycine soja]|uniref:NADPH--cytochrome P450 reductase 2 n=1 Tax=Glycine soja TaxID=3848 RepID=A0A445LZJ7_GLYSO|nr:NADPH--cytochrome P450 reductase 2 [Glycine soja]